MSLININIQVQVSLHTAQQTCAHAQYAWRLCFVSAPLKLYYIVKAAKACQKSFFNPCDFDTEHRQHSS